MKIVRMFVIIAVICSVNFSQGKLLAEQSSTYAHNPFAQVINTQPCSGKVASSVNCSVSSVWLHEQFQTLNDYMDTRILAGILIFILISFKSRLLIERVYRPPNLLTKLNSI